MRRPVGGKMRARWTGFWSLLLTWCPIWWGTWNYGCKETRSKQASRNCLQWKRDGKTRNMKGRVEQAHLHSAVNECDASKHGTKRISRWNVRCCYNKARGIDVVNCTAWFHPMAAFLLMVIVFVISFWQKLSNLAMTCRLVLDRPFERSHLSKRNFKHHKTLHARPNLEQEHMKKRFYNILSGKATRVFKPAYAWQGKAPTSVFSKASGLWSFLEEFQPLLENRPPSPLYSDQIWGETCACIKTRKCFWFLLFFAWEDLITALRHAIDRNFDTTKLKQKNSRNTKLIPSEWWEYYKRNDKTTLHSDLICSIVVNGADLSAFGLLYFVTQSDDDKGHALEFAL